MADAICDDAVLTAAERAAWERDGFLVTRGLLDATAARDLARWCDELAAWPEVPGRHMVYHEASLIEPGRRLVQRIENFHPYHDGFRALIDGRHLHRRVEALLGEPALLFKDKINFKSPGGDGFKPHQDQQAGWWRYASLFVTALVAVDAATAENGWLELAAGHHRRGLVGRPWEPLDDAEMAAMTFEPCPLAPGDVVFFDSFAPHRSGPNLSAKPRRALYVTWNRLREGDHRARYFAEKRRSFPPDIEREPGKDYRFRV
ncbi:MAG TPA: phytanoyl-CoA dioxygenase family protein [Alphaproteobacteria bacterium]|nr:phytanoyl-CoA dioxygenase family protein [Alphaproteobacteria bacterium]